MASLHLSPGSPSRARRSPTRLSRLLGVGAISLAAMLTSPSAEAASASLKVTVTATLDKVSPSGYDAFTVTIENLAGSVANQVRWTGSTNNLATYQQASTSYCSSAPVPPSTTNAVSCYVGQLRSLKEAPANKATFVVYFKAQDANGAAQFALDWMTTYSLSASPGVKPSMIDDGGRPVIVSLLSGDPSTYGTQIRTLLLPTTTSPSPFSTINDGSVGTNTLGTKITIPAGFGSSSLNVIEKTDLNSTHTDHFNNINTIQIQLPPSDINATTYRSPVTTIVRVSSSQIIIPVESTPEAEILNVVLLHTHDDTGIDINDNSLIVPQCPTGNVATVGPPPVLFCEVPGTREVERSGSQFNYKFTFSHLQNGFLGLR